MLTQVARIVREKIDAYEDECGLWKEDHKSAMLFFDFRELLREGGEVFRDICRLDENWRLEVLKKDVLYDAEVEDKIRFLVRRFCRTTIVIESLLLPAFASKDDCRKDVEEFRNVCEAVRGMVTSDDEFFRSDTLLGLRDEAVADDERGVTVEYDLA